MAEKPKLLVTGASGFLGWNLCRTASADWQVFGTYHHHRITLAGITTLPLDLGDRPLVQETLQRIQPAGVIHLAALSQPNQCEQNPSLSYQLNVTNTLNLAQACTDESIPLVFASTDLVFDGTCPPYGETDPVNPLNCYGAHKVEAEAQLRRLNPDIRIARMPLMFGLPSPFSQSFMQPFITKMRHQETLQLFTDEWRSPVCAEDASRGLLLALRKGTGGILHLGGPASLSRYQFGQLLADCLGIPQTQIQPCSQADVPMPAARPQDVSLNSDRAYTLGYAPMDVATALKTLTLDSTFSRLK